MVQETTELSAEPNGFVPEKLWNLMVQLMPIPCVDVIFVNENGEVLYGIRKIPPCAEMWMLPGGRILKGEAPEDTAARQAQEYGMTYEKLVLNGVFTSNHRPRSDICISYVAYGAKGTPQLGKDFSKVEWKKEHPKTLIFVHREMIASWRRTNINCSADMTEEEIKKYFNPAPNIYLGYQGHYWCSKCGEMVGFPVYGRVGYFRWNKGATAVETYEHKCKKIEGGKNQN